MVNLLRTSQLIERLNVKPIHCCVDDECEAKPTKLLSRLWGRRLRWAHGRRPATSACSVRCEEEFEQEQLASYDPRDYLD
jgi:hypothetical protein